MLTTKQMFTRLSSPPPGTELGSPIEIQTWCNYQPPSELSTISWFLGAFTGSIPADKLTTTQGTITSGLRSMIVYDKEMLSFCRFTSTSQCRLCVAIEERTWHKAASNHIKAINCSSNPLNLVFEAQSW